MHTIGAAVVLLLLAIGTAHANDRRAFNEGVEAARSGDYEVALEYFLEARRAGIDTPALHFNLGVALFQLGRLSEAADAFRLAAESSEMGGPASYNLGRIARERGDRSAARRWFQRAARRAHTQSVRDRALAALGDDRPDPGITISGSVGTGIGHDDNIALVPSESAQTSRESDEFLLADAYFHASLPRDWYLFGGAYTERYDDSDEFDFSTLYAGAGRRLTADHTGRSDHRLSVRHARFGGDPFEYALMWDSRWVNSPLRVGLGLEALHGATGYRHLDGHGWQLMAAWTDTGLGGTWSVGYRLSRTARSDLMRDDDFYSYSYYRNRVDGEIEWQIGASYRLTVDASWSSYRYDDPEVRNGTSQRRRTDTNRQIGTELERRFSNDWTLAGRFDSEQRNSNLDQFDYQRNTLTLRIAREF